MRHFSITEVFMNQETCTVKMALQIASTRLRPLVNHVGEIYLLGEQIIGQVGMLFQIGGGHGQGSDHRICESCEQTSIPAKGAGGFWCRWVPVSQEFTIVHMDRCPFINFSRSSDQLLKYYILYTGIKKMGKERETSYQKMSSPEERHQKTQ